TIRLRTSRPSGSVPSGKAALGASIRIGRPRSFRLNAYGSRGASTGARMATRTSASTITALTAPSGFRRASRATTAHAPRQATRGDRGSARTSAVAESGIKPGVAHVDEQVDHHDDRREEEHGALDQRV